METKKRNYRSINLNLFKYIKEDGLLIWNNRKLSDFKSKRAWKIWNTRYAGKIAGNEFLSTASKTKYRRVTIDSKHYLQHRIIWMFENGNIDEHLEIDHIDGNGLNNNISNLRLVDGRENKKNKHIQGNNTSGVTGVRFNSRQNKYVARINLNKKEIFLGYFMSFDEAVEARKKAEVKYKFHKNHGRKREKLLSNGSRGHKDLLTDLNEARWSISRAIELEGGVTFN